MILVGWQARWAAAIIFLWMIPVTYLFHAYWGLPPDQMQAQFIQFQKNMAIMGALLLVVAQGTGPYSLGKDKLVD
jgi:putative oxidoreductase